MPVGQRVILGKNRDGWPLAAELRAKRSLHPSDFALDLEPQFRRRFGQQTGGENLLEPKLGMLVNFVAERDHFVAVVIDRAGYLGVSVHRRAPLDAVSILSSTERADYPTRLSPTPRGVRPRANGDEQQRRDVADQVPVILGISNDCINMIPAWTTLDQIVNRMRLRFASGSRDASSRNTPSVAYTPTIISG